MFQIRAEPHELISGNKSTFQQDLSNETKSRLPLKDRHFFRIKKNIEIFTGYASLEQVAQIVRLVFTHY